MTSETENVVKQEDEIKEVDIINSDWIIAREFLIKINERLWSTEDHEVKELIMKIKDEVKELVDGKEKGAIPKTTKRVQERNSVASSISEDSEKDFKSFNDKKWKMKMRMKNKFESSEEDEHSSTSSNRSRRKKNKKSKVKENNEMKMLAKLLNKIDNRKVPELEPFDENAGIDLEEYIERFEEYYRDCYKGGKHLRLKELEKQLTGRTLEGLRSVRQNDDEYETVRRKLIKWYEGEEETRKELAKRKFEKAAMKPQETKLMYSNRLLQLFKLANPKKKFDKSPVLISKFQQTVNKRMRRIIENQIFMHKIDDTKMSWRKVQKCAKIYDLENEARKKEKSSSENEEEEEVVVINFSKEANENKIYKKNYWDRVPNNNRYENYNNNEYNYNKHWQNNQIKNDRQQFQFNCNFCGKKGHKEVDCRKKSGACFICGRTNHYAINCHENMNYKPYQSVYKEKSHEEQKNRNLNSQPSAGARPNWRR